MAAVNVGQRPAGSNMYISQFGYSIGKGKIPFLDTSLEFFEDVYEEIKLSKEEIFVEIDGCDDENQFKQCYEVFDLIASWFVIPFTVLNVVTARSSLKRIKPTKGTAPRIFISKFFFYQNIFSTFSSFFYLQASDSYFWPTGGIYKTNIGLIFNGIRAPISIIFVMHIHS
eukprot:snap_masked-scaffold_54-processed-gene-1.48-mRNA-1 protein AED:1.00 eAED:1.00 QI:0/0/0/0/1/1/2/0/169